MIPCTPLLDKHKQNLTSFHAIAENGVTFTHKKINWEDLDNVLNEVV